MNIAAEAKELLRNAQYADGQATVLTQDCEALEAAINRSNAIAPKLAEALRVFVDAYHSPQTATGRAGLMLNAERAARAALAEWDAQ